MRTVGIGSARLPSPLLEAAGPDRLRREGIGALDDLDDFLIDHGGGAVVHDGRLIRHRLEHQPPAPR